MRSEILSAISAERDRQIAKGFNSEHDTSHTHGELAAAAATFAWIASTRSQHMTVAMWPWSSPLPRREDDEILLIKAGALIVAELERIAGSHHSQRVTVADLAAVRAQELADIAPAPPAQCVAPRVAVGESIEVRELPTIAGAPPRTIRETLMGQSAAMAALAELERRELPVIESLSDRQLLPTLGGDPPRPALPITALPPADCPPIRDWLGAAEPPSAEALAFLRRTAMGGSIVSSATMTPAQIAAARAADRMFVTPEGYGFVYVPAQRIAHEFPTRWRLSRPPSYSELPPPDRDWIDELPKAAQVESEDVGGRMRGSCGMLDEHRTIDEMSETIRRQSGKIETLREALKSATRDINSLHSELDTRYRERKQILDLLTVENDGPLSRTLAQVRQIVGLASEHDAETLDLRDPEWPEPTWRGTAENLRAALAQTTDERDAARRDAESKALVIREYQRREAVANQCFDILVAARLINRLTMRFHFEQIRAILGVES